MARIAGCHGWLVPWLAGGCSSRPGNGKICLVWLVNLSCRSLHKRDLLINNVLNIRSNKAHNHRQAIKGPEQSAVLLLTTANA
eukprot:5442461-Amphidinium_carterae.1